MVFVKILVLILAILICAVILKYRERVVRMVGKNEYFERYLGPGGTYTFWILFAILIVAVAAIWLVGVPGCSSGQ